MSDFETARTLMHDHATCTLPGDLPLSGVREGKASIFHRIAGFLNVEYEGTGVRAFNVQPGAARRAAKVFSDIGHDEVVFVSMIPNIDRVHRLLGIGL
jgi:hypothetical protein